MYFDPPRFVIGVMEECFLPTSCWHLYLILTISFIRGWPHLFRKFQPRWTLQFDFIIYTDNLGAVLSNLFILVFMFF